SPCTRPPSPSPAHNLRRQTPRPVHAVAAPSEFSSTSSAPGVSPCSRRPDTGTSYPPPLVRGRLPESRSPTSSAQSPTLWPGSFLLLLSLMLSCSYFQVMV